MNLQQRLNDQETHQDWYGMAEALNKGLGEADDNTLKAELHLRLGRVLHTRFLQGVKALKHFQDAYKLNPSLTVALAEARQVYRELGKLNMVQKLLELQLKVARSPAETIVITKELGDVLCDEGQYDRAAAVYSNALREAGATDGDLFELVTDVQVTPDSWQDRLASLLRLAHSSDDSLSKSFAFMRAARIARRYAPEEVEGMLTQAYVSHFRNASAVALLENLLVESGRTEAILRIQRQVLDSRPEAEQS